MGCTLCGASASWSLIQVGHSQKEAAPKTTIKPSVEGLGPLLESGGNRECRGKGLNLVSIFSLHFKGERGKQKASPLSARGDLDNLAVVSRASPLSSLEVS